jgi:hypothetical protein
LAAVHGTNYFAGATAFTSGASQWACENGYALFHFAFVDACPAGGCLAGGRVLARTGKLLRAIDDPPSPGFYPATSRCRTVPPTQRRHNARERRRRCSKPSP